MRLKIVIMVFLLAGAANSWGQLVVIAHKAVPSDTLKKSELLDFYTCDIKKWSDGKPVVVFDLKAPSEVKMAFYRYLGRSSSRMKSIWLKKMLSGEGEPPEAMNSEEEVLAKVAATAGAIGFVRKSHVRKDVKVILEINAEKR